MNRGTHGVGQGNSVEDSWEDSMRAKTLRIGLRIGLRIDWLGRAYHEDLVDDKGFVCVRTQTNECKKRKIRTDYVCHECTDGGMRQTPWYVCERMTLWTGGMRKPSCVM